MDAWEQRKSDDRNSISRSWAALLIFLNLLAACSWRKPDAPIQLSSDSFSALKQRVASLRGLPFKSDVSYDAKVYTATENFSGKSFDDEYDAQSVARLSQVYKRVGLLPDGTDLAKALADFRRLQRLPYYDSGRETIVLAPESIRLGKAFTGDDSRNAQTIPVVFALAQALQEQTFQWPSKLKLIPARDRRLAFQAVARGDIALTGLAYLRGDQPVQRPAERQAITRLANELDAMASGLPTLLRAKLVFPYREGSQFVQWAYEASGLKGINGLFANPPLSTAQVLHPEKFYLRRQNPLRIIAWGLMQQMKTAAIIEQTLGEYLTQLILASTLSRSEAARIASAWTGDDLSAYADGESMITSWISAWESEIGAQEFARAFETVLARQRRLRFETADRQKDNLKADLGSGRSMLLQVRGSVVLFLDSVASTRTSELAERIWQDLETGAEPTTLPFESAQSWRQFASRRR